MTAQLHSSIGAAFIGSRPPRRPLFAGRAGWLFRIAALLLLSGAIIATATWWLAPAKAARAASVTYGPADFAAALRDVDGRVALGEERVARSPEAWSYQESIARALMSRARLTGSFSDLERAGQALAIGRSSAPKGAGPLLSSAAYAMTIHDHGLARQQLDTLSHLAVPAVDGDLAETQAIAADIAFFHGDYAGAIRQYRAAARTEDLPGIAFRMAVWQRKTGDAAAARATLDRAIMLQKSRTPQFMATAKLAQGGLALEQGDWEQADEDFAAADAEFPGYWLTKAHLAQMQAARGDYASAEREYLTSIKLQAEPAVMDALAALYRAQGKIAAMRPWAERAGREWDKRMSALPTAAAGHALEHELVFGDAAKAVEIGKRDYAARPYGDSAMLLGAAYIAAGQPDRAVALLAPLEASGWRTAQSFALLATAEAMRGNDSGYEMAKAKALDLNPRAFDPAASLIWFGHH